MNLQDRRFIIKLARQLREAKDAQKGEKKAQIEAEKRLARLENRIFGKIDIGGNGVSIAITAKNFKKIIDNATANPYFLGDADATSMQDIVNEKLKTMVDSQPGFELSIQLYADNLGDKGQQLNEEMAAKLAPILSKFDVKSGRIEIKRV